jgi:hypothetical protein
VTAELVPRDLGPGLVQPGFSETLLERIAVIESPRLLYDGSAYLAGLAQKWNGHGAEKNEIKAAQMFCEVRLGQLLGPNPGHGPGRGIKDSDGNVSSLPLPPRAVTDFRRYLGHFDPLVEAVRNGKRSRRSLLLLVDELEAADRATDRLADGMPAEPTYAELEIRCGDFREVLQDIEPGTVTLILTDPPYPTEYLPLWTDLGKWGAQALCEGGSLIAYCGQSILPDVLNRLNEHLRYWWGVWLGEARPGEARHGRRGRARPGEARHGTARQARQGRARRGSARRGSAGHGRHGMAGMAGLGAARQGAAWQARHRTAGLGVAWPHHKGDGPNRRPHRDSTTRHPTDTPNVYHHNTTP